MKPRAVIVDVDGTLVDVSSIRHYVMRERDKKDFQAFHAAAKFCPPIETTLALVKQARQAGLAVLVVTARRRKWEHETRGWLNEWTEFEELHMRDDGDHRKDFDIKRDILASLRERFEIVLAIDDNPSVLALWESESIQTIRIPGWVEE